MTMSRVCACLGLLALVLLGACASALRPFPLEEPLRVDPDTQPFSPQPATYFSPMIWDAADNLVFRPVSNFFAVDPARRAINVNAVDEVPASSWFEPRLGHRPVSSEEIAIGPCDGAPPLDPAGPWTVTGGKPDGENPGFFIKGQDGSRYLLKFDGVAQAPRATAADAIVTRMYWAAGYHTPCNRIVFFDKSILSLAPNAMAERSTGQKDPMTQAMVDQALERATQLPDGRYRGNASLYLKGKPLGPWRYEGTRDDDANDVVPHEDRRELRAASVIASWVNHFDSREQNSLDMWNEVDGGRGYIRHYYLDFGDCFGSMWDWDALSRRWGHSTMFDVGDILLDFATLGLLRRPWDKAAFGPSGEVFGYFAITPFDPAGWVNEYPNPAFGRMQLDDAHWMARILADFDAPRIERVVAEGHLSPELAQELMRILIGRRQAILETWLPRLTTLSHPVLEVHDDEVALCVRDLAIDTQIVQGPRTYQARAWLGLEQKVLGASEVHADDARICATLPATGRATLQTPSYLVVELAARGAPPLRVHLYQVGDRDQPADARYRIVGLERPR